MKNLLGRRRTRVVAEFAERWPGQLAGRLIARSQQSMSMTCRIELSRIISTDRERVGTQTAPTLCLLGRQVVGVVFCREP